jgi:hypothetical protein
VRERREGRSVEMGFKDKFKASVKQGKDSVAEYAALAKKRAGETSLHLDITTTPGGQPLPDTVLQVQPDGYVYFRRVPETLYVVTGLKWDGPQYTTQLRTVSNGKTKRTGRVTGAVVGTIIAPGWGTAIGAGLGTGNKRNTTDTVTYEESIEVPAPALVTLTAPDGSELTFGITCTAETGNLLLSVMPK